MALIPRVPPAHRPRPPATTDLSAFAIAITYPFPEGHMVGISQGLAFSPGFLSLSKIQLRFLHVFSWSTFLFSIDPTSLCGGVIIHPSTCRRPALLLPGSANSE